QTRDGARRRADDRLALRAGGALLARIGIDGRASGQQHRNTASHDRGAAKSSSHTTRPPDGVVPSSCRPQAERNVTQAGNTLRFAPADAEGARTLGRKKVSDTISSQKGV